MVAVATVHTPAGEHAHGLIMLTSEQVDDLCEQIWARACETIADLLEADGRPDAAYAWRQSADNLPAATSRPT